MVTTERQHPESLRHPTVAELAAGRRRTVAGSSVWLRPSSKRWLRLELDRSTALVVNRQWPESTSASVSRLARDLARLHGLSTGLSSWFAPEASDHLTLQLPVSAADLILLPVLVAELGDGLLVDRMADQVAAVVADVNALRLVEHMRKAARLAVDGLGERLAPW